MGPPPDRLSHPRKDFYWFCECGQEEMRRADDRSRSAVDGSLNFRDRPCPRCKRSMMLVRDPEEQT